MSQVKPTDQTDSGQDKSIFTKSDQYRAHTKVWSREDSYDIFTHELKKGCGVLPKTYRTIQQWDNWLEKFPGHMVLDAEKKILPSILAQFYGTQSLLIGAPRQLDLLKSSVIPNQILLSPLPSHQHQKNIFGIESGLHCDKRGPRPKI